MNKDKEVNLKSLSLGVRRVMCLFRQEEEEEGNIQKLWREGERSYDESRHVSPLSRVFLGLERAAAAAGTEY